jgi:hypothetical protein
MAKILLALLFVTASGLNVKQESTPLEDESPLQLQEIVNAEDGKAVVQNLRSDEGMAYYGSMFVGGQEQVSIYDTGSFDIVIESKCLSHEKDGKVFVAAKSKNGTMGKVGVPACCTHEKCPFAKYSTGRSGANFVAPMDTNIEQITYGSGPVLVKSGMDHVSLMDETTGKTKGNKIAQAKVPVKIIVDHEIDLFKETEMTAIVGMGPGPFAEREKRLVSHMGVKRFMVCFQENAKANGFWTWNDRDRSQDSNWMTVPVAGKMFWAVPTSNFKIDGTSVGCEPSCGGIMDTGTSLLTPPQAVVTAVQKKIENGDIEDCSDLSKFPDFEFQLGEHKMSLPASTYIGDAGTQQIEVFHQQLAFAPLPMTKRDLAIVKAAKKAGQMAPPVHACVLLLSPGDESEQTQFGPMVIFGMSLFRKYAVQFDLSGDMEGKEDTRAMRFAEAAHDCSGPVKGGEFRRKSVLQRVNMDKLRVSPLQQRLTKNRDQKKFGANLFRKGTLRI